MRKHRASVPPRFLATAVKIRRHGKLQQQRPRGIGLDLVIA